jgi:hypothetical protein
LVRSPLGEATERSIKRELARQNPEASPNIIRAMLIQGVTRPHQLDEVTILVARRNPYARPELVRQMVMQGVLSPTKLDPKVVGTREWIKDLEDELDMRRQDEGKASPLRAPVIDSDIELSEAPDVDDRMDDFIFALEHEIHRHEIVLNEETKRHNQEIESLVIKYQSS